MDGERTLLCFGDSNTHGACPMAHVDDRRRYPWRVRWTGVLAAGLGQGWRVVEEGHNGRTTVHPDPIEGTNRNGLAYIPVSLESHQPIDVVLLMLGTNDLKARYNLPPSDIAAGLNVVVRTICASEAGPDGAAPGVIIMAPPPILETGCLAEMFDGGTRKSTRLADLYRDVAHRYGAGFIDTGRHIVSSAVDGIHFDIDQHAELGKVMVETVEAFMR
ncbi:MAG: SGNH/GDSL hydrolase family protein [Paracoccaceae bacterium]